MTDKVFAIEDQEGPFQDLFHRIMRMVPDRDKNDKNLQRLLAFRLKLDGEAVLRAYLTDKIRDIIQCGYTGSLYNFLKDDLAAKECGVEKDDTVPPGVA